MSNHPALSPCSILPVPPPPSASTACRLMVVGGFLGAGKTTTMLALARGFEKVGHRSALITNDQSAGLVDTAMASDASARTGEITGGCFCCRADDLIRLLKEMGKKYQPTVIIAEPVGSCTDLAATVIGPLKRRLKGALTMAPLAVVVDARRLWQRYFGKGRPGAALTREVGYIFDKQMEEAEVIVLNKVDLLKNGDVALLRARTMEVHPRAELVCLSAINGEGVEVLMSLLTCGDGAPRPIQQIDYALYAKGESQLGWLNGEWTVDSRDKYDPDRLVLKLARVIQKTLAASKKELGHLKVSLSPETGGLSVANAVTSTVPAQVSVAAGSQITGKARLLINIRAQAAPLVLRRAVKVALLSFPARMEAQQQALAAFRPAAPVPNYVERLSPQNVEAI